MQNFEKIFATPNVIFYSTPSLATWNQRCLYMYAIKILHEPSRNLSSRGLMLEIIPLYVDSWVPPRRCLTQESQQMRKGRGAFKYFSMKPCQQWVLLFGNWGLEEIKDSNDKQKLFDYLALESKFRKLLLVGHS